MNDGVAAFLCKRFDPPQKFFTPEVVTCLFFFFVDDALDFALGSDSGVIGSWQPQGAKALHAMVAHNQVFDLTAVQLANALDANPVPLQHMTPAAWRAGVGHGVVPVARLVHAQASGKSGACGH